MCIRQIDVCRSFLKCIPQIGMCRACIRQIDTYTANWHVYGKLYGKLHVCRSFLKCIRQIDMRCASYAENWKVYGKLKSIQQIDMCPSSKKKKIGTCPSFPKSIRPIDVCRSFQKCIGQIGTWRALYTASWRVALIVYGKLISIRQIDMCRSFQ